LKIFENYFLDPIHCDNVTLAGIEKLFNKIFFLNKYNNLVRPIEKESGLTNVVTELKLLQLDLV